MLQLRNFVILQYFCQHFYKYILYFRLLLFNSVENTYLGGNAPYVDDIEGKPQAVCVFSTTGT